MICILDSKIQRFKSLLVPQRRGNYISSDACHVYIYKHKTKHDKDKRLQRKYKIKFIHTQTYINHLVSPLVLDVKTV